MADASDSPSRRLRKKISDFFFFRGAGHSSRQTQKPSGNLEVPSRDTEASPKKRVTRFQLFGMPVLRKKLNQPTALSPFVSSRDMSDFGELSVRAASSDR